MALRQWAESVRQTELEKALTKLESLDERERRKVRQIVTDECCFLSTEAPNGPALKRD